MRVVDLVVLGPGRGADLLVLGPGRAGDLLVLGLGRGADLLVLGPGRGADLLVLGPGRAGDLLVLGPGRAGDLLVLGPGRAGDLLVLGPGRAADLLVLGPGRAADLLVLGPGRAADLLVLGPGRAANGTGCAHGCRLRTVVPDGCRPNHGTTGPGTQRPGRPACRRDGPGRVRRRQPAVSIMSDIGPGMCRTVAGRVPAQDAEVLVVGGEPVPDPLIGQLELLCLVGQVVGVVQEPDVHLGQGRLGRDDRFLRLRETYHFPPHRPHLRL